ncbi:MAG TPA: tRNA (cytidine(34)-2'-O)-methyltransferase [Gemmataceae bacterium]|jgi:tRNA (cytidine/uridine-2'-O-)-methyltransferase|nr:tRNA (cytidine(34)-2'-O)-methyltransferase [Gemmataceae bacterium]
MDEASSKCPVLRIALWEPEIPPNTGNVARLCAATGAELHLIGRLGFRLDDRKLRRAGLEYWSQLVIHQHVDLAAFENSLAGVRLFAFSAHSRRRYTAVKYEHGDCLLFGGESHGLPASFLERMGTNALCLPMPADTVRSLNLATAAGIATYEALRQIYGW